MNNKYEKEDFNEKIKDTCHYMCSSVNWTNIILAILVIILLYAYFNK